MFQDHALFPHRDVAGNVGFGLRMQGRPAPAIAARVAELLELVGLGGAERRSIRELSGGEQQRVALARALAPEPSVLLLDEALGALDRTLRERLVAELRSLFGDLGLTVVAVTHDQHEAFALADRVAVMDAGRFLQVGPPATVWERPTSARVAQLLGLANVIEVDVVDGVAPSPWGDLAVGGPSGRAVLLVRPDGVALEAAGPTGAVVRATRFLGARSLVELEVPAGPVLEAEVASASCPGRGTAVRFRIDPAAVVRLGPDSEPGGPTAYA
jgi:thiamine transport system ATP-binding protein